MAEISREDHFGGPVVGETCVLSDVTECHLPCPRLWKKI